MKRFITLCAVLVTLAVPAAAQATWNSWSIGAEVPADIFNGSFYTCDPGGGNNGCQGWGFQSAPGWPNGNSAWNWQDACAQYYDGSSWSTIGCTATGSNSNSTYSQYTAAQSVYTLSWGCPAASDEYERSEVQGHVLLTGGWQVSPWEYSSNLSLLANC